MIEIIRGETRLEKISLVNQTNGNPVLVETLTSVKVELYQNLNTFATYEYPSDQLRLGDSSNELFLEVTSAVSNLFLPGVIRCKITISQPMINFTANPYAVDCIDYEIYKVVITQKDDDILENPITKKTSLDDIVLLLSSETLLSSSTLPSSGRA